MDEPIVRADLNHESELELLSRWLGEWDPSYDLYCPPRDALLFEPDGTLYAIGLGDQMSVTLNHRERTIHKGDAIVVPQGLALPVEPEVAFLAVRHGGPPPDHFRERFIQVWGYDLFTAELHSEPPGAERFLPLIAVDDLRYPLSYGVWELTGTSTPGFSSELNAVLLVGLDGTIRLSNVDSTTELTIRADQVVGIIPGLELRLQGQGRLGFIRLTHELLHLARRKAFHEGTGQPISPERPTSPPHSTTS